MMVERLKPALLSREYRWEFLPYGVCQLPDGSLALFNRRYRLIYTRSPSGAVERLPPEPPRYESQGRETKWFYDDGTPENDKRSRGIEALAAWGVDPRNPDVRKFGRATL
jgi:hypothetical protein